MMLMMVGNNIPFSICDIFEETHLYLIAFMIFSRVIIVEF